MIRMLLLLLLIIIVIINLGFQTHHFLFLLSCGKNKQKANITQLHGELMVNLKKNAEQVK